MVDMEKESVEGVFEDCPYDITGKEGGEGLGENSGCWCRKGRKGKSEELASCEGSATSA
jgi:hypothetical protein